MKTVSVWFDSHLQLKKGAGWTGEGEVAKQQGVTRILCVIHHVQLVNYTVDLSL